MNAENRLDVFVSYSSRDKLIADALCARLEAGGIRCWIAPRDVSPGLRWGECILRALDACRVMVLLVTRQSNVSPHVAKEVERAVHKGMVIIPMRMEDVRPEGSLEYFLSDTHWMDALTPPMEAHFDRLLALLRPILAETRIKPVGDAGEDTSATASREKFVKAFEELAVDEWHIRPRDSWLRKIARIFDEE